MVPHPNVTVYWGPVERADNEGLWANSADLGQLSAGQHSHKVGGYTSGDTVYYRVKAVGATASDWSDKAESFRTVGNPLVVALPATDRTKVSATLHGQVTSNGGEQVTISLNPPGVSEGLIAHWRFDEGTGVEAGDSTGFNPAADIFGGVTWTAGMGGAFGSALDFDGGSLAYIQAPNFRISGIVSFAGWAYKRNLGNWQRMFDFGTNYFSQSNRGK